MTGDDRPPRSGFSGDVLRLLIGSAVTILLFAGGVYWLRHQPMGARQAESGTAVQVRLLTTEEPTPFPLTTSAPSETSTLTEDTTPTASVTSPSDAHETDETQIAPASPVKVKRPSGSPSRLTQRSARTPASELTLRFQNALLRHISRFQQYPEQAQKRGMQGRALVVFVLRRDGSVADAWVQSTSGEVLLDDEALATIRRA
jgi:periplasmic protein TonB